MTSLTEAFLQDLEELGEDEEPKVGEGKNAEEMYEEKHEETKENIEELDANDKNQIAKGISTLLDDLQFIKHLQKVEMLSQTPIAQNNDKISAGDEEYRLVTKSNEYANMIEREIANIHKYVRDIYSNKFPELESLILNPLEYVNSVMAIKNQIDLNLINLDAILNHHTVVAVTLAGSSTSGKPLQEKELANALRACQLILKLNETKKKLLTYIESRMQFIAPNLSAIVGSTLAAQLMAAASGIEQLANMPACNIQVLGAQRKNLLGFSKILSKTHLGLFGTLDIVKNSPQSFQTKLVRMLATNTAKAARVDISRACPSGSIGKQMKYQMFGRFDKIQEAAPPKMRKPLPIPDDKPKKRRGGKRYRNMKEKDGMTELRKNKNRLKFGEEGEQEIGESGIGLGMLGHQGIGKVKFNVKQNKMQLTKRQRLEQMKRKSKETSGLASSIAFTPMKTEIELVNPELFKTQRGKIQSNTSAKNQDLRLL